MKIKYNIFNYLRLFLKIYRVIKHNYYGFTNKRILNYNQPNEPLEEIGVFDNNLLIHANNKYHHLFKPENIYKSGNFTKFKNNTISIVRINKELLIKKKYHGFLIYDKFYNEIICINQLSSLNQVPKIKYIDYKNYIVYIQYIDGLNFKKNRKINKSVKDNLGSIIDGFKLTLKSIHNCNIIVNDIGGQNMILSNSIFYIIDFADSIYFNASMLSGLHKSLFNYLIVLDFNRFNDFWVKFDKNCQIVSQKTNIN